jgi:hypothetical protein
MGLSFRSLVHLWWLPCTGRKHDRTIFQQQAGLFTLEIEDFDTNVEYCCRPSAPKASSSVLLVGQNVHTIALLQMAIWIVHRDML